MPAQGSFDANQFKPNQGGQAHPIGQKFDFQITNTEITATKDQQGGMFVVEFTTPAGSIVSRYNIWNASPKAAEIAHGQLSALCHATGVFRLDWANDGAALRGARGKLDVGYQKGEEPTAERPAGGYVEVKKVYDANGNEPGKGPAPSPQPQQWANPASNPAASAPNAAPPNGAAPQQGWQPGPSIGQQGVGQQAPQGWQQGPQQNPVPNANTNPNPPWAR